LKINKLIEKAIKYDYWIILVTLLIAFIGLANLYSASYSARQSLDIVFYRQVFYVSVGITLMFIFSHINYKKFSSFIYLAYVINLILLILVLFFGHSVSGSKRWLSLGFINIQPSEIMKLTLILTLAKYFSREKNMYGYSLKSLFFPFLIAFVPALLIIVEPDLGTGLIVFAIAFIMFLFVKIKTTSLISLILIGVISLPLVYSFALKDYQKKRVLTFVDPSSDPKGSGYNILQSKIAVGSGRILGKGFTKGTQSQLKFLPEHHTDFIFSVFAEEHGFIGSIVLLILYTFLFFFGVRISSRTDDKFGAILAIGLISILFLHTFINIGMVIGIMPVVGVTLPFMSYGGTSIIVSFLIIGILQSISIKRFMF
jgi:rod shape determining protein RodA